MREGRRESSTIEIVLIQDRRRCSPSVMTSRPTASWRVDRRTYGAVLHRLQVRFAEGAGAARLAGPEQVARSLQTADGFGAGDARYMA
jgi:hypothetical protein